MRKWAQPKFVKAIFTLSENFYSEKFCGKWNISEFLRMKMPDSQFDVNEINFSLLSRYLKMKFFVFTSQHTGDKKRLSSKRIKIMQTSVKIYQGLYYESVTICWFPITRRRHRSIVVHQTIATIEPNFSIIKIGNIKWYQRLQLKKSTLPRNHKHLTCHFLTLLCCGIFIFSK